MKELQEDLSAIIAKHLPAQVGKDLKLVLEKAEDDAKQIKTLLEQLKNLTAKYDKVKADLIEANNEYDNILKEKKRLLEKEEEIFNKERKLAFDAINILNEKTKAECAEKSLKDIFHLASIVFSNPSFIDDKIVTENGMFEWNNQTNRNEWNPSGGSTEIKTKTKGKNPPPKPTE